MLKQRRVKSIGNEQRAGVVRMSIRAVKRIINYGKNNGIGSLLLIGGIILLEINIVEAKNLDVKAAGDALTKPIMNAVDDYWPIGVFSSGIGGAIIAQGDLATKAIGFAKGVLACAAVIAGAKMGLGV